MVSRILLMKLIGICVVGLVTSSTSHALDATWSDGQAQAEPAISLVEGTSPDSASAPEALVVGSLASVDSGMVEDRQARPDQAPPPLTVLPLRRHWDAGLELRAGQFYGKNELLLHTQWLRHWPSGIKLGGFLTSLPQPVRRQFADEKPKLHFYAIGLTAEFDVFRSDAQLPWISLGLNVGQGWFVRRTPAAGKKSYQETDLYVAEPYVTVHPFHWFKLDWGLGVAYQKVQASQEDAVKSHDLPVVQGFFSFRHQM